MADLITEKQRKLAIKQKSWQKKYDEAPVIDCACGCGEKIKNVDHYGRPKRYITGHNTPRIYDPNDKHANRKAWVRRNRSWVNTRRQKIARKRKIELIARLGNGCQHCGLEYNGKNGAVFEFHHIEPETKKFGLGSELTNKAMAELRAEVDKCVLLCANCHQIYHLGEY